MMDFGFYGTAVRASLGGALRMVDVDRQFRAYQKSAEHIKPGGVSRFCADDFRTTVAVIAAVRG